MRLRRSVGVLIVVLLAIATLMGGGAVAADPEEELQEPCSLDRYVSVPTPGSTQVRAVAAVQVVHEAELEIVCTDKFGPRPPDAVRLEDLRIAGLVAVTEVSLGQRSQADRDRYRVKVKLEGTLSTAWRRIGLTAEVLDRSRQGDPVESQHSVTPNVADLADEDHWEYELETTGYYRDGDPLRIALTGALGYRPVTEPGVMVPGLNASLQSVVGTAGPNSRQVLLPRMTVFFDIVGPENPNVI